MEKNIPSNESTEEHERAFVPGINETISLDEVLAEIEACKPEPSLPEKTSPASTAQVSVQPASVSLTGQTNHFTPVKELPAPEWKRTGIYTIDHLNRIPADNSDWLVHNLIRDGNQVVLSGPPKSGKTILALQLAMDLGVGSPHFLDPKKYQITQKQPVLFLSFEMRQRAMAIRLAEQWSTDDSPDLRFMFGVPGAAHPTLFTLDFDKETVLLTDAAKELQNQIRIIRPKLIILDSLIQVHSLDENSNMKMGAMMRMLRRIFSLMEPVSVEDYQKDYTGEIEYVEVLKPEKPEKPGTPVKKGPKSKKPECIGYKFYRRKPIAHVILHHTRKGSDMPGKPLATPDSIRGASSIHSEADLAITLANAGVNLISINKSSRELAGERTEFYMLKSDNRFLRVEPAPPRDEAKKEVLARIYKGLRAAGSVYAETVNDVLKKEGLLGVLMRGKSNGGFRDAFVKKLAKAGLNAQKPSKGAGHKTQIELIADSDMADFFAALDVDGTTAHAFELLPALEFTPVTSAHTGPEHETPATAANSATPKDEPKKKLMVRIYKGLRAAGTVYSDSIYEVLIGSGLINALMRGKSIGGFRDAFVKKLAMAGLNTQKPSKGAGHKTQIRLPADSDMGTFLKAFGVDAGNLHDFGDLPALEFPSVEPEKSDAGAVELQGKKKPTKSSKNVKPTPRPKTQTPSKKRTKP